MRLKQDILGWDGKSARDIETIYKKYCKTTNILQHLMDAMMDPLQQKGASWMLKHYCERGGKISDEMIDTLYHNLNKFNDWQTQLHILQAMPYMPIAKSHKQPVEIFLRKQLTHENKFIRAWTYNAFHLLAQSFPEFKEEVALFFELAMKDEAPSVKARIRNIHKGR